MQSLQTSACLLRRFTKILSLPGNVCRANLKGLHINQSTGLMGNRSSKSKNDGEKSETARAEMIRDPFGFYWKRVYAEKRQTVLTSYDPGS